MKLSTIPIRYSPIPVAKRNDAKRPVKTSVLTVRSLLHINFSETALAKGSINANNAPNPPKKRDAKNAGPII